MSVESESDIYRIVANKNTGELEPVAEPEQHDGNREFSDIINIPENNDDLLAEIEIENQREDLGYFNVMRKLENLDQEQVEQIWVEVGDRFKAIGIFTNHSEEGIDVFREPSEWVSPFPITRLSQEEVQSNFGCKQVNIGGLYKNGNVYINEDVASHKEGATRENLASLADGYGLGEETDTLIHEIYHGFQDVDPEDVKQFEIEISELQDRIKAVELEAQISGKPPYAAVELWGQLKEMKKTLLELRRKHEPQTQDEVENLAILKEIHAHMFSDPTRYRGEIESYTEEGVGAAYLEMPIRRLHEKMIGINRGNEDKDGIAREDYMRGKEDQAYMALRQIEALRALGMNNAEIGKIISGDKFDAEKGYYINLQAAIFQQREQLGIDRDQHLKIIERFRLSTIHKALKARNTVQDLLGSI